MERQKSIPLLSTKITRKLAQESADHNTLMNFYSQISRDETGAPKRWKMSNPEQIDEGSITSSKTSGRSTPSASRESSGERRRSGVNLNKSINNIKRNSARRESVSSDGGSSRDSSIENKEKKRNSLNENQAKKGSVGRGRRSFSAENNKKRKMSDVGIDVGAKVNQNGEVVVKKKRGRPKSLDLSQKNSLVANGDDERFKSPDPLTPCNIAVKRRKGRPKETPPTLVAESPVPSDLDLMSLEDGTENITVVNPDPPLRKKPGRKPKKKRLIQPSILTGFALKKFESTAINNIDSNSAMKTSVTTVSKGVQSEFSSDSAQLVGIGPNSLDNTKESANNVEMGSAETVVVQKRKPGRPPGAKNKRKTITGFLKSRRKAGNAGKSNAVAIFKRTMLKSKPGRKPGRPVLKLKSKIATDSKVGTDENTDGSAASAETEGKMKELVVKDVKETTPGPSFEQSLAETFKAVIKKSKKAELLQRKMKEKDRLRKINMKKKGHAKSLGKLKKEKNILQTVKKKRILTSHAANADSSLSHLASNDLRRKLQSKLIERLSGKRQPIQTALTNIKPAADISDLSDDKGQNINYIIKDDLKPDGIVNNDSDIQSLSAQIEQKRVTKVEQDGIVIEPKKRGKAGRPRKSSVEQKEITKFSDSDSVCSEMSSISMNSFKRFTEKQVLILGEDNVDSDDTTVRTRQRFEIIPGKKRKRTLSGEFDLVDERQLRKEMKNPGDNSISDGLFGNETDAAVKVQKQRIRSPVKISPETIQKIKQSRLEKKNVSPYRSAYRAKMLKQSPFLSRLKRKRRVLWKKRKQEIEEAKGLTDESEIVTEVHAVEDVEKVAQENETVEMEVKDDKVDVTNVVVRIQEEEKNSQEICEHSMEDKKEKPIIDKPEEIPAKIETETKSEIKLEDTKKEPDIENLTDEEFIRLILSELIDKVAGKEEDIKVHIDEKTDMNEDNSVEKNKEGTESSIEQVAYTEKAEDGVREEKETNEQRLTEKNNIMPTPPSSNEAPVVKRRRGRLPKHMIKPKPEEKPVEKPAGKIRRNARKSVKSTQESPDSVVVRKFELRQKISRSPLDNIALKQSIEENEYYKKEAEKAFKKEAKQLKLKKSSLSPELPVDSDTPQYEEHTEGELSEGDISKEDIEDLLRECKPCSVVLTDFIKQLQRAQGGFAVDDDEDEQESDEFMTSENDETDRGDSIEPDDIDNPSQLTDKDTVPDVTESTQITEGSETNVTANKVSDIKTDTEVNTSPKTTTEPQATVSAAPNSAEMISVKTTIASPVKRTPIKRKTPMKRGPKSSKGNTRSPVTPEQQTARKTVPPLKIKLKGGVSSRRKTYMIEPLIESTKFETTKITEKKRSKTKSGSKSESDSEKHSKGHHHHHRKRNKSPLVVEAVGKKTSKKSPVPTDAYEANFLQFIQHNNEQPTYDGVSAKPKPSRKMNENKMYKVDAEGSLTVTAKGSSETNTSTKSLTSVKTSHGTTESLKQSDKPVNQNLSNFLSQYGELNDAFTKEVSDSVNYICFQCEKVVCKSEEEILRHFKEVHPDEQMMYKPLAEIATDAQLQQLQARNKLATGNIFDRMNDLLTPDQNKKTGALQVGLEKTSAEADSTTDVNTEQSNVPVGQELESNRTGVEPENREDDGDISDSGSLNLKIVEVVSLKDQVSLHDDQIPGVSQPQQTSVSPSSGVFRSSELKIPHYPRTTQSASNSFYEQYQQTAMQNATSAMNKKTSPPKGRIGNTFKCEKCNVHAPLLAAMVAHLRNTHKDIPRLFQCPYCRDMEAENEAKIHAHIRQLHPTDNPNPPVALSEPAKRNLKTLTVRLPDIAKPGEGNAVEKDIYMCLNCRMHLCSLEMIYQHLDEDHKEVFVFMCPVCKKFKSKDEGAVKDHILNLHSIHPESLNISLAIDGNQFTRVPCLIKDKTKGVQKSQQQPQLPRHPLQPHSPFPSQLSPQPVTSAHMAALPVQNFSGQRSDISIPLSKESAAPKVAIPAAHSNPALAQLKTSSAAPPPPVSNTMTSKSSAPQGLKKKKNLLESIQQLHTQKQLEQQGLLLPKSSANSSLPISSISNQTPASNPPPLIRGPPPLIRFDQLEKVPSSLIGPQIKTSSSSPSMAVASAQRLHALGYPKSSNVIGNTAPRPIQSSLFDTSDPEAFKIGHKTTVLNVPNIGRSTNKHPAAGLSKSPHNATAGSEAGGAPLDLSKATPSSSPVPPKLQSPPPPQETQEVLNPEIFKVFNLQPSAVGQQPRPAIPLQSQVQQQVIVPQQLRPNTSNTLAYRPQVPHIVSSHTQLPQIINMPMNVPMGAVIGNMLVSIASMPQNLQGIPQAVQVVSPGLQGVTQMQGVPQFVRMSAPIPVVSPVTNIATPARTMIPVQANQQIMNLNLPMFKCPYCPKVIPLKLADVQPHIEKQHPGSSIVFMPIESPK